MSSREVAPSFKSYGESPGVKILQNLALPDAFIQNYSLYPMVNMMILGRT